MTDEKGQEQGTSERRAGFPPLEREWAFLRVHPWSNSAMFARQPIGVIEWADRRLDVYAATRKQVEDLRQRFECADEQALKREVINGAHEALVEAAWLAFGGEKSPMSKQELLDMPQAFVLAAKEAANAFLWDGPASAVTRPMPQNEEPKS